MKLLKGLFSLCWILFLTGWLNCSAQNLVPNPGFENFTGSPTGAGQLNKATPWVSLGATPDLFAPQVSLPINPCDAVGTPVNVGGYAQVRNGGNAYAGIAIDP